MVSFTDFNIIYLINLHLYSTNLYNCNGASDRTKCSFLIERRWLIQNNYIRNWITVFALVVNIMNNFVNVIANIQTSSWE